MSYQFSSPDHKLSGVLIGVAAFVGCVCLVVSLTEPLYVGPIDANLVYKEDTDKCILDFTYLGTQGTCSSMCVNITCDSYVLGDTYQIYYNKHSVESVSLEPTLSYLWVGYVVCFSLAGIIIITRLLYSVYRSSSTRPTLAQYTAIP